MLEERLKEHDEMLKRLADLSVRLVDMQAENKARIEQNERQIRALQRLWVRLAERHGWLEEGDLLDE